MPRDLYVSIPLDPSSLQAADDREYREARAASSVVSITRESAEERRRREFWEAVDTRKATPVSMPLRGIDGWKRGIA